MAPAAVSRWQARLRRRLGRCAVAMRFDFVLPDGVDGYVHLELALLRPEGLYVLETLEGEGRLMAGERLPEWTLTGRRRFVFPNPLPPLEHKLAAARIAAGRVPFAGLLVLSDRLEVPLAVLPDEVVPFADLATRLPPLESDAAVPPDYAEAWARLENAPDSAPSGT